jgi:hypothetical protein
MKRRNTGRKKRLSRRACACAASKDSKGVIGEIVCGRVARSKLRHYLRGRLDTRSPKSTRRVVFLPCTNPSKGY